MRGGVAGVSLVGEKCVHVLGPSSPSPKPGDIIAGNTVTHSILCPLPCPDQGFLTFFTEDELDADSLRFRCNVTHTIVTSESGSHF